MGIRLALKLCLIAIVFCSKAWAGNCQDELKELFRSSPVAKEQLREFLKIQSGITLHKLAYASVRSSGLPEEFRLEKEILKLLDQVEEEKKNSPEFAHVHRLFHEKGNKVSRSALAKALPYVADILNDQRGEQSPFERRYFNIDQSDLKMLAILAQREQFAAGKYASAQWRDTSSDKSILNFTKIINSSVRTSGGPSEGMLKRMDKRIGELHSRAIRLLSELDLSEACKKEIAGCMVSEESRSVISPELTEFLTSVVDEAALEDKYKYLRYDDVWLYTGKRNGVKNKQRPKKPAVVVAQEHEDPAQVIHGHLMEKVLKNMPQLFTREDLEGNRELTLALARAIDQGILFERGEKRVFSYDGKSYYLPELWNAETVPISEGKLSWLWRSIAKKGGDMAEGVLTSGQSSALQNASLRAYKLGGLDFFKKYPHIDKEDMADFLNTMSKQKHVFGQKFAFTFKGKLFSIDTGRPIGKGVGGYLSEFVAGKSPEDDDTYVSPFELGRKEKEALAEEIQNGNKSFIFGGRALHISGAPVELEAEYDRIKSEQEVAAKVRPSYPSKGKIKSLADQMPALTLKTLANRDRAFTKDGRVYDFYIGEVAPGISDKRVTDYRRMRKIASMEIEEGTSAENFAAILNGEPQFVANGKTYYTDTGRLVGSQNKGRDSSGFLNHELERRELQRINNKSDLGILIDYHKKNPNDSCPSFSVVDKKNAKLKVLETKDNVAQVVWESEVLLGSKPGDGRTRHSGGVKPESNDKTAAGIFRLGELRKGEQPFIAVESFEGLVASISAAGGTRDTLFKDGDSANNRATNGGIMLREPELNDFLGKYHTPGCPFYILPEGDEVRFQIVGSRPEMVPRPGRARGDFHYGPTQPEEAKEIKFVNKPDFVPNATARKFLDSLAKNKARIMRDLGISNIEYNELARVAFGISGVESQFGDGLDPNKSMSPRSHKEEPYGALLVFLGKLIERGQVSFDPDDRSRGLTQIKGVENYPFVRKFGGITKDNLMEPENAAVATMYVLGDMLGTLKKNEGGHPAITDQNRQEFIYYLYNGQLEKIREGSATPQLNGKARKVTTYADSIDVYTK